MICECDHQLSEHHQGEPGFCLECDCPEFCPKVRLTYDDLEHL